MIANCFLSQQKRKPTEELARLIKTQAASFYSYYNIIKKFPEIYKAQIKNRDSGGLSGSYQWRRLSELNDLLKFFNINSVLEFVSGTSSYIFANRCSRFLTFEENLKYRERLISNAPANILKKVRGS